MDAITRRAVQEHLTATVEWLRHANNVPAEHALPLLTEAMDNLGAAIDTIQQDRNVIDAEPRRVSKKPRLPGLTTLGCAESLQALAESRIADTRLTQLINQASHHA